MSDMLTPQWQGWETVGILGQGSFGTVYEIRRDMLGDGEYERAALKVISIPQNQSDIDEMVNDGYDLESIKSSYLQYLKSILGEYSLMRKMNGSSFVVNCDDVRYEPHADGIGWDVFIKMELLTPMTKSFGTSLTEQQVIKIGKDLCSALILCKKHDIVHRDIKPQNIFYSPNGDYKLGDFGISKTMEKTSSGTKVGTYRYMAPEVYHNQPYGSAADIYSLGLVLYWLLNERRMPFVPLPPAKIDTTTDNQCQQRRLSGEPIPAPAHGSNGLKWIVLKACAHDQATRYDSAEKMLQDLQMLEDGKLNVTPIASRPVTPVAPVTPAPASHPGPLPEYPPVGPAVNRGSTSKTIGIMPGSMEDPLNNPPSSRGRTPNGTIGILHGSVDDPPSVQPNPPSVHPDPPRPAPAPKPEKKAKSPVKWIIIAAAALVVCAAVVVAALLVSRSAAQKNVYQQAQEMLERGDYAGAIDKLDSLNGNRDSEELLEETRYNYAQILLEKKNYGAAVEQLSKLGDYLNAEELLQEARYAYGTELMSKKDYAGAEEQFEKLGSYKDAETLLKDARYCHGTALVNSGEITAAIATLEELGNYKDALKWLQYAKAEEQYAAGAYEDAYWAFNALGNFENAKERTTDARYFYARKMLKDGDVAGAMNEFSQIVNYKDSARWLAYAQAEVLLKEGKGAAAAMAFGKMGDFEDARERSLQLWASYAVRETIAAGDRHTVALKADGTVLAVGETKSNQCNVSNWKNIVAVSAGRYHTVGLDKDGTVWAVGFGDSGVCDVDNWTDIVAISTGRFHTVGLKTDGTVISTLVKDSKNSKGQSNVSAWRDIIAIAAGYHHTVGLRADGTVVAVGDNSYGQLDVSEWTDIVAIAAGGWHTVGLKADGTVVAVGINKNGERNVSSWTNVVAISAGHTHTVALRAGGTVLAVGNNTVSGAEGVCDVSGWRKIVAIVAGHCNTVGLTQDGELVVVGGNDYGQMEADGWTDIRLPQ